MRMGDHSAFWGGRGAGQRPAKHHQPLGTKRNGFPAYNDLVDTMA